MKRILSRNASILVLVAMASLGGGYVWGQNAGSEASAQVQTDMKIDRVSLEQVYRAVFARGLDDGAEFHVNKNMRTVLTDLNNSPERRYYSAVFKAIKAYEDAIRAPGNLTDAERQVYLRTIESAIATLAAWAETLPEKDLCMGVTRPEEAREAIIDAYASIPTAFQGTAERGLFNSAALGTPAALPLPPGRCMIPRITPGTSVSPTISPTTSPTMSPTVSPTISPSMSPTPSPTMSPTMSPTVSPTP